MGGIQKLKYEFIFDEMFQASLRAAFSTRNKEFPIYTKELVEKNPIIRIELKKMVKAYVDEFKSSKVTDKIHFQKIEEISDSLSNSLSCKTHLHLGRFRIRITQKILNLTLKYLWCADVIDEPPHCPIDRVIKNAVLKYNKNIALTDWTKIDSKPDYYLYINTIKDLSKGENLSIAKWELKIYNENRAL